MTQPVSRHHGNDTVAMRGASIVPIQGRNEGTAADITDLLIAIGTIESRILRLVRRGDREMNFEELKDELSIFSRDLGRCYRSLADLRDRRDLSFATQRKLERMQEECIWLYQKAHREVTFFKKLSLEARLRSLVSQEAFSTYQQLLCVDDEERRFATYDDVALAGRLLAEPEPCNAVTIG
jgi:hypothetical protein